MSRQQVNRYTRTPDRRRLSRFVPLASGAPAPIHDTQTGFIHHPAGFPLEWKRLWFSEWFDRDEAEFSDIGLMFESDRYLRPGTAVEIRIPLRNELEIFRGKVVLVRHDDSQFQIGVWLRQRSDAVRARIVEQICHIEAYLHRKKITDGPYVLDRDRAAEEWITQHAGTVPSP